MCHIPFTASQFTPTSFNTSEDKAKFANKLVDFIASGFPRSKFRKAFYARLSMTFGFIAHYNIHGFYGEYFEDEEDKRRFLAYISQWPCYGSPSYTYSDVEKAVRRWLEQNPHIQEALTKALFDRAENEERSALKKLQEKYPYG